MNTKPPSGLPPLTWERIRAEPHRLLMCDYDGTLAPFRVDRSEAVNASHSLTLLVAIAWGRRTSVAVVSGRPIGELEPLFDAIPAWIVGEHGWEIRRPDGSCARHRLDQNASRALLAAADAADAHGWGALLERKRASVVLHTRGLPDSDARAVEEGCARLWRRWRSSSMLRLAVCNGGIELRARGYDKGTAVSELLRASPDGTYPVYLGDDDTDEDAFAALRDRGLGIRVGSAGKFSLARERIESQDGVASFLETWLARVEGLREACGDTP